jgi:hypothetical protein
MGPLGESASEKEGSSMRSRRLAALGLAALATVFMLVPASADAMSVTKASAGAVVTGRVLDDGHGVKGAHITLYAWPKNSLLANMKDGQHVALITAGTAVSSSSGAYSVAVSASSLAAVEPTADPHGIVNLEVMAVHGSRGSAFYFPRRIVTTSTGKALAADNNGTMSLAPQHANITVHDVKPAGGGCGYTVVKARWKNRSVVLGGEYSHIDSVYMGFSYGTDQNSNLGVGTSATGDKGSWSASGTWSIDGGVGQSWPRRNKADGYARESHFEYQKYLQACVGYGTHVTAWEGSDITKKVKIGKATLCEREYAPTTITYNQGSAWTYASGVNLVELIGIDLSAQTGYDKNLVETYDFTDTKHARYLCGRSSYPNTLQPGPGYVVAGTSPNGG